MQSKKLSEQKKFIEAKKDWVQSPIIRHYSFSDKQLWDKQVEVLWSVRNNKKTTVKSGNTVGKSFISADVVMDYMTIYGPQAKVITTAPTWTQVEGIIWKEISSYYRQAKIPIGDPNALLKTELKLSDEWFAMGISTNEVYRFQGFHSPHLLVVIDEAAGVAPEIWQAVEALHPHRVLAIGNPNENVGNFYDSFNSPLWNKITISCGECVRWQEKNGEIPGLVTREWIEERREEWGEQSPEYQIHVLGEFPEETEDSLVSRRWVEDARKRKNDEDDEEECPRIVASDVATKHGKNLTVIGRRYGHTIKGFKGYRRIPLTETADRLAWEYSDYKPSTLVVDSDGVGEGVADFLESKRVPHTEFHGGYGQKAIDAKKYRNLRSQFYCIVANKFERGLYDLSQLDQQTYEILKNQLCSLKVRPPDAQGRIWVESKEDMKARGIESPDYSDTFMMMEFGFWMSRYADIKSTRYR